MPAKVAKKQSKKASSSVEVKQSRDIIRVFNAFVAKNMHDRYKTRLTKNTQQKIVSYGPWLAALILLVIAPELLIFAKEARLISLNGFIETVLFNRESWVLLLVILANCILTFDALGELFNKTERGWNRVYSALLINSTYVLYQLAAQIANPAAPIVSILLLALCLFVLFDIRKYYK